MGGGSEGPSSSRLENKNERMRNIWFFYIMLPSALVAAAATRRVGWTIAAAMSMPLLAFFQGFFGMLSYRCFFGDAPKPLTPAHGVVVVHPDDAENSKEGDSSGFPTPSPVSDAESVLSRDESNKLLKSTGEQPPIRLLVMGDSLSVGVGQSKTCTPVLPETIAKTISKRLGGRTVCWTCHGSPGASTGWIVKQLENKSMASVAKFLPGRLEVQSSFSDSEDLSSTSEESSDGSFGSGVGGQKKSKQESWKERLETQSQIFEGDIEGPYDITVLVTGSNDLKSTFFPFLLKGEAAENWKDSQERGGYEQELLRLLSRVKKIMRPQRKHTDSASSSSSSPKPSPIIVFPGMPARALPAFQHFPLQHLSVPMVDIMDSHKRDMAEENNKQVLFVPPPPLPQLDLYAGRCGKLWEERCRENVAVTLHNHDRETSSKIESDMKQYYGRRDPCSLGATKTCPPEGSIRRMLSGDPPAHWGTFSIDKTHPNEYGYDFWGRHIGNAILEEWERRDL